MIAIKGAATRARWGDGDEDEDEDAVGGDVSCSEMERSEL